MLEISKSLKPSTLRTILFMSYAILSNIGIFRSPLLLLDSCWFWFHFLCGELSLDFPSLVLLLSKFDLKIFLVDNLHKAKLSLFISLNIIKIWIRNNFYYFSDWLLLQLLVIVLKHFSEFLGSFSKFSKTSLYEVSESTTYLIGWRRWPNRSDRCSCTNISRM